MKINNATKYLAFLVLCGGFFCSAVPSYAQTTENFAVSVYYDEGANTTTASCSGSTNLDSAKRHGWLYSGYLFHIFLEGTTPDTVNTSSANGQDNLFGLAECDDSFCYMQQTFGYMPGIFYVDGSPSCSYNTQSMNGQAAVLNNIMRILNYGFFSVLMIVTGYAIIQGVFLGAMQEGSILNQRLTLRASTRICVGAFLIIPQVGTGYSSIQIILMYVVMLGVGLADRAFSVAVDSFITTGYVFSQQVSEQEQETNESEAFLASAQQTAFKKGQTGNAVNPMVNPNNYGYLESWPSNINLDSYVDIMRRMVCAQYQVYSRILRTNDPNYSLGDGLSSVQLSLADIATITNNNNGVTTVAFGDRSDPTSDYYNWCGWVVYPTTERQDNGAASQLAPVAMEILNDLNNDVSILFQNAITTMENYRKQDYDVSNEDMMAQYYTCLKQQNVTIYSPTAQASANPTCSESSEWQSGTNPYTNVVIYPCQDSPNDQPGMVGAGGVGTLQGQILKTWDTENIPWLNCGNLGVTTTLNNKTYSSCIEQVAANLSSDLARDTGNYNPCRSGSSDCSALSASSAAKTYMFILGKNSELANSLRTKSITSNTSTSGNSGVTKPSCMDSSNNASSCYQYDIYQMNNADNANGTSYVGSQWDLITAYRLVDWALAAKNEFDINGTSFNNIYQGLQDYNAYTAVATVDPASSIASTSGDGPSKLDTVTYNLLNPIYNSLSGVFSPKQGFLISSNLSPSTFNLTQSIFMILEKFYGIKWFNTGNYPSSDGEKQYFNNFWDHASEISALSNTCTDAFNNSCAGGAEGCFDKMVSSGCITTGGLLGAANIIQTGEVNYNPFKDFIGMGNTIMLATAYYIIYNNIDLFIVNCIASAVFFALSSILEMVSAALRVFWAYWGPSWVQSLSASFGYIASDALNVFKELDMSLVQYYTGICDSLIFLALPVGFMMGVLIPFYPILIFVTAVFGWFVSVFEAMIAAPLIAVGLAHPAYHDVLGKSTQSILLIFSVFLQPVLLVFGVFFAITVLNVMIIYFNTGYIYYLSSLLTNLYGGLGGEVIILVSIGLLYVYMMMIWEVVSKSCQVMVMIPDRIMRWMDSNWQAQASGALADKLIGAAKDASSGMASAVQSGAQGSMQGMAKGRQQLSEAAMKVATTGITAITNPRSLDDEDGLSIGDIASQHAAADKLSGAPSRAKMKEQGALLKKHDVSGKIQGAKDAQKITKNIVGLKEAQAKLSKATGKEKEKLKKEVDKYKGKLRKLGVVIGADGTMTKDGKEITVAKVSVFVNNDWEDQYNVMVKDKDGNLVNWVDDAKAQVVEAEKNFNRDLKSFEINNDPRSVQDMAGPKGPKTTMTVGELNKKINSIQEELAKNPSARISINSTDDMIAARAAGGGWKKIMAGYGKNGISADKALTNQRFMKMLNQASKVKQNTNAGDPKKGSNALDRSNNEGQAAADQELSSVFKDCLQNKDGTLKSDNFNAVLTASVKEDSNTSQETAAILQKIGVPADVIVKGAAASNNDQVINSYTNVDTFVNAGYGVDEIYNMKLRDTSRDQSMNIPLYGKVNVENNVRKVYTKDDIAAKIIDANMKQGTQQVSVGGKRVSYKVGARIAPSQADMKALGVTRNQYRRAVNRIKQDDRARGK